MSEFLIPGAALAGAQKIEQMRKKRVVEHMYGLSA